MSSRPNTPGNRRRDSSRKSHRSSGLHLILPPSPNVHYPITEESTPLESDRNIERLENLSESAAQLSHNMTELSKIHNAVNTQFNEPFASFLYGLFLTMFCNSFPGCPTYEQFESILKARNNEQKIEELNGRISKAKEENARLQQLIAQAGPQRVTSASIGDVTRTTPYSRARLQRPNVRTGLYPTPTRKKVTVAQDDTSTSESFADTSATKTSSSSKIPQPSVQTGTGPNLNQPPRYMRGLFDKTPTNNIARGNQRVSKKASSRSEKGRFTHTSRSTKHRPPFR